LCSLLFREHFLPWKCGHIWESWECCS
jgi:hypothetical protein